MAPSLTTRVALEAALLGVHCLHFVAADFNSGCNPSFAYANMDPIVGRGQRSGHAHHISGSIGFSPDTINGTWMQNNKSTCDMPGDFSNYWTATLYRTDLGGTPTMVPVNHRAYYSYDAKYPIDPNVFSTPFPMILGSGGGLNNTQLRDLYPGIIFLVGQPGDSSPVRSENFDNFQGSATDADTLEINFNFPPCWDGVTRAFSGAILGRAANNLAYPTTNGGPCPATHPVRIPEGKIAARYLLDPPASWDNGNPPFFLSSGRMNTAHADAVFLWNSTVLGTLIANCLSDDVSSCDPADFKLKPKVELSVRKKISASYGAIPAMYKPGAAVPPV